MQSKQKWCLDYEEGALRGCCGIGVVCDFSFNLEDLNDYGTWQLAGRLDRSTANEVPTSRQMLSEIRRMTRNVRRGWKTCLASITDQDKFGRDMLEAFKKCGWEEITTSKSNHGRYNIHLLMVKRRRTK